MKHLPHEAGFAKNLIVLMVAAGVVFIFLFKFAQNFQATSLINLSTGGDYTSRYEGTVNPLLDLGASSYDSYSGGSSYSGDSGRTVPNIDGSLTSPYAGRVTLSLGNARYAIQTYEEYLTMRNSGGPVSITGWTLANGKGSRPIEYQYNNYVYPLADSATIGEGTEFLSPDGRFETGPIVLEKGDTAILQTGKSFAQFPFSIHTNFRENICVGHLQDYPFTPSLSLSCPAITSDPFIRTVTDKCYDYMASMGRCEDPGEYDVFQKKKFDLLTTECRAFIAPRSNYRGCVADNKDRPGFSGKQWRVFLNKDRELWAKNRETITLYDAEGYVVDRLIY